jgi:hypothetical protein
MGRAANRKLSTADTARRSSKLLLLLHRVQLNPATLAALISSARTSLQRLLVVQVPHTPVQLWLHAARVRRVQHARRVAQRVPQVIQTRVHVHAFLGPAVEGVGAVSCVRVCAPPPLHPPPQSGTCHGTSLEPLSARRYEMRVGVRGEVPWSLLCFCFLSARGMGWIGLRWGGFPKGLVVRLL